jgi:dihydrofolate reductase
MKLALIAAVARNGAIGGGNALLWRLPEDARFFKHTTHGHPVVMGRRTWDSLPERFRPLPGRLNVVVTRQPQWQAEGAVVAHSLDDALARVKEAAPHTATCFVIGGAELYAQALPVADRLVLTEIDRDFDGNVHFPAWERAAWREVAREHHRAEPPNDFDFSFVTYERRPL